MKQDRRCSHGVRWPHPCDDCHAEDMKPENLIAKITDLEAQVAAFKTPVDLETADDQEALALYWYQQCLVARRENERLEALVGELGEALRELEQTEADYRHMRDLHGGGSIKTGRRWDWMRRAGDKARATLAKLEKARG